MIDLGLLSRVKQIYAQREPLGVKISDVLAVIEQESAGVPVFFASNPLFGANLYQAAKAVRATEKDIRDAITIQAGPLRGMWCKFRFEPSYLPWAQKYMKQLKPAEIALICSSVGLGQQMLRYVIEKEPVANLIPKAQAFMGDVNEQIRWVMGNLERHTGPDRQLMFAKYNLDSAVHGGKIYNTYGHSVMTRAEKIDQWLEDQSNAKS